MDTILLEYLTSKYYDYKNTINIQSTYNNSIPKNCSFFVFDLDLDKCKYFSSSIKNITGYNFNKYLYKGIVFLKTFIHPEDYSDLISELLTYIFLTKEQKGYGIRNIHIKDLTCRIMHKNGYYIRVSLHVMYLTSAIRIQHNILMGILEELEHQKYEYMVCNNTITNREKEVLQLIGNGDSSKIIADKLNISETTAITHRKNLIQKLNVKNTAELIKEAVKAKIIE